MLETSAEESAGAEAVQHAISVRGVTVNFGGIKALDDLNLDIPSGQLRGLVGPNGAGKTTLFDVISGIRRPNRGAVFLHGRDVTSRPPMQRARVGLRRTFQRQQIFSWLTVEENVLCALEWRSRGGGVMADAFAAPWRKRQEGLRRERVKEVLEWCGLDAMSNAIVGQLPPGQVRLVELGRALADSPSVLLLDEPTSGLGAAESRLVSKVVRRYVSEEQCTAIVVEHDIEFVVGLCDQVTVLDAGRIIFDDKPEAVQTDPGVRKAYLG